MVCIVGCVVSSSWYVVGWCPALWAVGVECRGI